jgi:outer membrane receptor protein involved in Fe transport
MKMSSELSTIKLQAPLFNNKIYFARYTTPQMFRYLLLLCFLINGNLYAQNSDSSFITLDSIVVESRNIKISELANPFIVSSLSAKQIQQNGARTTPEALMGVSGIFLQKTNHGGGSAFIRGLTGNQTLLVIDGIRINNATFRYGPNQYLNTIDMFTLNKINVLKGIGAIEYGSDAMGGVIQMETKQNAQEHTGKLYISNTSKFVSKQMESTNRTELQFAQKKWDFIGGLSIKNYGDVWGGKTVGKQAPTGYSEMNYDLKAKIKINDRQEITIASQNTAQKNIPIYHKIVLENYKSNQVDKQVHNLNYLTYKYKGHNRWISSIIMSASMQRSLEKRSLQKNNTVIVRTENDSIQTTGLTAEILSKPTIFWSINTGFDYYKDRVNSIATELNTSTSTQILKRGLYPNNAGYNNSSLFTIHYINAGKFKLITGVRYNFLKINLKDSDLGTVVLKPSALISNFGLNYQFNKNNAFFGSFTSGYRAPNIDDLGTLGIVDFRYEIPSYDLKPEKSLNVEFGYKYNSSKKSFAISAFNMKLKDIIARVLVDGKVINGYNVYNKKNIESSYINGAEISFTQVLHSSFVFQTNATYTYGQNSTKNEPMRRIPPFFGQNTLSWKRKNIILACRHQFAGQQTRLAKGDMDDNRIGIAGTPSWNTLNVDASIEMKHIDVQLNLINLLNEKYKTHGSGVYGMGSAVGLMVRVHL